MTKSVVGSSRATGRAQVVGKFHFESLRKLLDLPESALVDDALHFMIGPDMNVVALPSAAGRLLLVVELSDMNRLLVQDWQRLVMHLSSHFDDDSMGRLLVLDKKLSMAWSCENDVDPDLWAQHAKEAMLWCTGTRQLLSGLVSPVNQ